MKGKSVSFLMAIMALSGLLLSACKSNPGYERPRKEYEYVPPVVQPMPTPRWAPTPTPAPVDAMDATDTDADTPKKRSFFSRLFSKKASDIPKPVTVSRVGDHPNMEVNEEGEMVEREKPTDNVYRLKIGDSVYITLSGSAGLNEEIQTIIDEEGGIKLRFIGSVKAEGLSPSELEREIEAEYTVRQKIYKDITVRVVVPNTSYFIGGEVRQPGKFPLVGRVTLSQAVVAAGNFTEWADEKDIILIRNNEKVKINFKKIRQNPSLDVELLAGDTVRVGRTTF